MSPRTLLSSALLMITVLAACADRGRIDLLQVAAPPGTVQTLLVATNRAADTATGAPGAGRSSTLRYGQFDISIPPQHQRGAILVAPTAARFDPHRHFAIANATSMDPGTFRQAITRELSTTPASEREVIVFVHGFNTSFVQGLYRTAQLSNDLSLPGVMVHFSWPSVGQPLAYATDRDSVLHARDSLEATLNQISAAGARRIVVIGHSMGAQLVMETLRQLAIGRAPALDRVSAVILVSPDIDTEVFVSQAERIGELPQPFLVISSQRDRVLQLSARLSGQRDRLGNVADPGELRGLGVTLIDVSAFSTGSGHFTAGDSPALLALIDQLGAINSALGSDGAGNLELIPATVLTIRNTTQIILRPFGGDLR